jgi:hypothetical protein
VKLAAMHLPCSTILCLLAVCALAGSDSKEDKSGGKQSDPSPKRYPELGKPWTNSIGTEFLPVPGLKVLLGIIYLTHPPLNARNGNAARFQIREPSHKQQRF